MKTFLLKNLQGTKILWLFSVTTAVYLLMILITIPKVAAFADGMKLLDLLPLGYQSEYVYRLMTSLGEDGRNAYLFNQIPLDMVYPGLFAITYALIFAYFLKMIGKLHSSYFYLCYLPVIAGLFDYFENFGIISIILTYPGNSEKLNGVTSVFSVIKSLSTTIYYFSLIFLLLFIGISRSMKHVKKDAKVQ